MWRDTARGIGVIDTHLLTLSACFSYSSTTPNTVSMLFCLFGSFYGIGLLSLISLTIQSQHFGTAHRRAKTTDSKAMSSLDITDRLQLWRVLLEERLLYVSATFQKRQVASSWWIGAYANKYKKWTNMFEGSSSANSHSTWTFIRVQRSFREKNHGTTLRLGGCCAWNCQVVQIMLKILSSSNTTSFNLSKAERSSVRIKCSIQTRKWEQEYEGEQCIEQSDTK